MSLTEARVAHDEVVVARVRHSTKGVICANHVNGTAVRLDACVCVWMRASNEAWTFKLYSVDTGRSYRTAANEEAAMMAEFLQGTFEQPNAVAVTADVLDASEMEALLNVENDAMMLLPDLCLEC